MANPEKDSKENIERQDEISKSAEENKHNDDNYIDGIKTGKQKQKRYYDKPFDEQMYDSFDDIRDQQGDRNDEWSGLLKSDRSFRTGICQSELLLLSKVFDYLHCFF